MKLRIKIPLAIVVVSLCLSVVLHTSMRGVVIKGYERVERSIIEHDVNRIKNAFENEAAKMASYAGDYSRWDDTYNFIKDRDSAYIQNNYTFSSLKNLKSDFIVIIGNDGSIIFDAMIDDSSEVLTNIDSLYLKSILSDTLLWQNKGIDSYKQGIHLSHGVAAIMGATPICKSDMSAPVRGVLIFGRLLDDLCIEELNSLTQIKFSVTISDSAVSENSTVLTTHTKDSLAAKVFLGDLTGKGSLRIDYSKFRAIIVQARKQLAFSFLITVVISIVFTAVLVFLMEKFIIGRLSKLSRDIRIIRQRKKGSSRLTIDKSSDELSELVVTINGMLDSLAIASRDIQENEKKFRLAFENAKDAYVWVDCKSFVIMNINKAAETLFELEQERLLGRKIDEFFPSVKVNDYKELLQAHIEKDKPFDIEMEILTESGTKVTYASGAITLLIGHMVLQTTFKDITKERAAEIEKQRLEEQLRQAQKMEVIGQLAGGVAHDFNNMLSGISGYSDLILRKFGSSSPELEKYATIIHKTASSAAETTAKLLAFARKGKNEITTIDLNSIVQDVVRLMEHSAQNNVIVSITDSVSNALVVGDRSQIQNAILNLSMNGVDAMPNGGKLTFKIDLADIDEAYVKAHPYKLSAGKFVVLSVEDTGVGMDEKVKARLFEPFFTTKGPGKGTGLGLASVFGTMKSHGGAVSVYSEEGRGTVFKLYFPVAPALKETIDDTPESSAIIRGTGAVLVIDDEAVVRSAAKDILTELGYKVETAIDGKNGIEFYAENYRDIDLVILDIIMPKLGGLDTFKELIRINPSVTVLVCSGYSINAEANKLLQSGAKGFIQKPFDVVKLSRAVAELLDNETKK